MDENQWRALVATTFYRMNNLDGDLHVMPRDDWFEHIQDVNCVCTPKPDEKNAQEKKAGLAQHTVWVHNQVKYGREGCH